MVLFSGLFSAPLLFAQGQRLEDSRTHSKQGGSGPHVRLSTLHAENRYLAGMVASRMRSYSSVAAAREPQD